MDFSAWWQAVVLGLIQGFTEFLPISSSAHLVLGGRLLHLPYWGKSFDLLLHAGSLVAALYFFRAEVASGARGLWSFLRSGARVWPERLEERLGAIVVIATLPTAVMGFALEPLVEKYLQGMGLMAFMLGVFGVLLAASDWWAQRYPARVGQQSLGCWGWRQSLFMGLAQGLAFIPGVSRSGISLTAARLGGLAREQAVRLALMMSLPVIGAAVGVKLAQGLDLNAEVPLGALGAGLVASLLSSWLALRLLARWEGMWRWCALYRVLLALLIWHWA